MKIIKTLKFIFWNIVWIFMAVAWEIIFYPFWWAWENFVNEDWITCIPINIFRYIVIIMLYYIIENKSEDYIEELEEENDKLFEENLRLKEKYSD